MKRLFLACVALLATSSLFAQSTTTEDVVKVGPYTFTKVIDNPTTTVKNQASSGTCWAYSAIATIESDIIKHKGEQFKNIDLSELYVARNSYYDRFVKYVRMHGKINFSEGGSFADVVESMERYGVVPQEVYQGLNYGYDKNVFGEIWAVLKGYADAVIANKNGKLTTAWRDGFNAILDTYFGKLPETFMYNGVEYTPKSFAKYLGFSKHDYISLCSFTHVPFGENHIIEVPDNWIYGVSVNVTLDDLVAINEEVLNNGYTVAWASDVSEKGFSHKTGLCLLVADNAKQIPGDEQAKWEKVNKDRKEGAPAIEVEREVTPQLRQDWYDNYETTDDHGMQLTGIYKDQDGKIFYRVKNSWDTKSNPYGGFFYTSQTFFKGKTLNIMIHKNSLSKKTLKKLGVK